VNDDRAQLRARLAIPADRDLPPGRHLSRRENLMNQMLNEPPRERNRWPSARRPSARGRLLATAAAVAVVAGLGVTGGIKLAAHPAGSAARAGGPAAQAGGPAAQAGGAASSTAAATPSETSAPPTTDVTAATLLRKVGAAAGAQPGGWPNAAYWYVKSTYIRASKPYTREIWQAHYGSGVLDDNGVGSVSVLGNAQFIVGLKTLTWDQLYQLPTDPAKLKAVLVADDKGESDYGGASGTLFSDIGDLLTESPASPALRQALYDVAATIPGVTIKDDYTDRLGRTGTAVSFGGNDSTGLPMLVIDPSNGAPLDAVYGDYTRATCTGGTCVSGAYYSYLSQGPADTVPKFKGINTASFVMPSVVGDTVQLAVKVLTNAGIGGVEIGQVQNGTVHSKTTSPLSALSGGVVVAQSPAAGATVAAGTPATLTVKS